MRRRLLAGAVAACAVLAPAEAPSAAAVPVLVIEGKGFGHGVGMAQDGAYWMGRSGASTAQILGHFYPGTKQARASGEVRVVVATAGSDGVLAVSLPGGGEVRDTRDGRGQSPGFPVAVAPGQEVRLRWDGGRYRVEGGRAAAAAGTQSVSAAQLPTSTTTTPSSTTTTAPPSTTTSQPPPPPPPPPSAGPSSTRPLWAVPSGAGTVSVPARARRYRGVVEATADGGFRLVNHVDVEQYLRGMGEVRDPRWPPASLRAQAVAARTYAMRAMGVSRELCDTQRCQVYLGAQAEYAAMDKAVADTRGQVLAHGSRLASTVYSANGGGHSASREEGFGVSGGDEGYPYLRAAPYPTQDPGPWTVRVATSDAAARLGYPGQLTGATVSRAGPSGRALEVRLDGGAGPRAVSGLAFARAFGLRSTMFRVAAGTADVAPPPPTAGEVVQALPEEAGPVADPNALPPVPLSSELAAQVAVPPLPPGPDPGPFRFAPVETRRRALPWASLALFLVLSAGAGAAALHLAGRRRPGG